MDDGSVAIEKKSGRISYTLNTQGFSLADNAIIVGALKKKIDIDATLSKDKTYYRISIAAK
jgi:hypothetical protein